MLYIFDDERRGHGPIAPDPFRDGTIFSRGRVAGALCGTTTLRRPLLTTDKNRSRHGDAMIVNRP